MRIKVPAYYSKFRCVGGSCADNCCIGWGVEIDEDTEEKYKKLGGCIGERIRKNITPSSEKEPACFKAKGDGKCPFLNGEGLCDIIISSGEDMLCDICKRHPRYFTQVDDFAEGGIGLCCLTAAKIILNGSERDFIQRRKALPYKLENELGMLPMITEKELISFKDRLLSRVIKKDVSSSEALYLALENAELLMRYIDFASDPDMPCEDIPDFCGGFSDKIGVVALDLIEKLAECEMIDEGYNNELTYAILHLKKKDEGLGEYLSGEFAPYFKRLLWYFVHRYFTEGLVDCSVGVRLKLGAVYALAVGAICFSKGATSLSDIAEISKNFSKNIEYSEENTEKNISDMYSYYLFTKENLNKIFS